ncbi:MAG TPA: hypothetical protein VGO56_15460 [Pyrinomonadaceae bacterium]|jgi:hypothetical protein|nr:hypothetical protein [Pyrinomonadaceae bacterium]
MWLAKKYAVPSRVLLGLSEVGKSEIDQSLHGKIPIATNLPQFISKPAYREGQKLN